MKSRSNVHLLKLNLYYLTHCTDTFTEVCPHFFCVYKKVKHVHVFILFRLTQKQTLHNNYNTSNNNNTRTGFEMLFLLMCTMFKSNLYTNENFCPNVVVKRHVFVVTVVCRGCGRPYVNTRTQMCMVLLFFSAGRCITLTSKVGSLCLNRMMTHQ